MSEEILESVWCVRLQGSRGVGGDGKAAGLGREVVDGIARAGKCDGGNAEVFLVPKVHACLVADFHVHTEAPEELLSPLNDGVLGLIGGVCIKVKEVVVTNASLWVLAFENIPDCLEERASC